VKFLELFIANKGAGKTLTALKWSNIHNIPILTYSSRAKEMLKHIAEIKMLKIPEPIVVHNPESLRGRENVGMVVIDNFDEFIFQMFNSFNSRIGKILATADSKNIGFIDCNIESTAHDLLTDFFPDLEWFENDNFNNLEVLIINKDGWSSNPMPIWMTAKSLSNRSSEYIITGRTKDVGGSNIDFSQYKTFFEKNKLTSVIISLFCGEELIGDFSNLDHAKLVARVIDFNKVKIKGLRYGKTDFKL
jgi:hypothetical protein